MWKRGQPNNQDEQAHPEKFLLRMYIGRYCVCNIFIYIATIRLSNSALDRKCACVDKVTIWYVYMCLIYIYILLQFVYPTPLAYWECDGVDKVACSIYIYSIWHVHMCLIYTYIASIHLPNSVAYWECNCVDKVTCPIYIYFCRCCLWVYLSTQPCLPTGSVLVWTKSLFDTYICVWYIYIYCHYSSTQPRLPTGSVMVWTKSRARYMYIFHLTRIYVSDIYMYCHYSSTQPRLPTGSVIV